MRKLIVFISLLLFCQFAFAQVMFEPNYDESKVPKFKLPEPLKTFSGKKVKNSKSWEKRFPEN